MSDDFVGVWSPNSLLPNPNHESFGVLFNCQTICFQTLMMNHLAGGLETKPLQWFNNDHTPNENTEGKINPSVKSIWNLSDI